MEPDLPARVRASTAAVMAVATRTGVDLEGIARLADRLVREGAGQTDPPTDAGSDGPWRVAVDDDERAVAMVLTLAAVNFGSGWHPVVTKRPGRSGATSMAERWRDHTADPDALRTNRLRSLGPGDLVRIFEQVPGSEGADLAERFGVALRELAAHVDAHHGGSFLAMAQAAGGSAARLATELATIPAFADRSIHVPTGIDVWFAKRAQLAAADLHRTFPDRAPGGGRDLAALTAFADNLVPHVLRLEGAVWFAPDLVARIERGEPIEAGSVDEIEIRAAGVQGVELLVGAFAERGVVVDAAALDAQLWARGGRPEMKARPRHRTRSPYY